MAGALRAVFGVCANEWSPSDGRVVSLDHGCGAHSETDVEQPEPTPIGEPIVDEFAVDLEQVLPTDDDATSPEDSTVEVEVAGEPAPEAVQESSRARRPALRRRRVSWRGTAPGTGERD